MHISFYFCPTFKISMGLTNQSCTFLAYILSLIGEKVERKVDLNS